MIPIGYSA